MKLSLVIPTLRRHDIIDDCIDSFKGHYDELIIIGDQHESLAYKQNKGMRLAKGDFIVVSNDDVVLNKGSLRDLCKVREVLSPTVNNKVFKPFHGHLFCVPRVVYAQVGGFDESCPGVYHIDSDLWLRFIKAGFRPKIEDKVNIEHRHPASTINTLPEDQRDVNKTREWFRNKWGEEEMAGVGA